MRDFRSVITSAFLALAALTATVNPSEADTGTVRVLFGSAGVVAGVGSGKEFEGRALNLRSPGDLAGTYVAVGAGGAIAGGIGVARLRNANGVVLVVRGPKLGVGLSVALARVTIKMM